MRSCAAMKTIDATATTPAPPAAVWGLLADASTWSQWGAWSSVEVEGGVPQGPGSVRVLVQKPFRVRERITDWVPEQLMGYELLEGMRVRGYQSQITLEAGPQGGTTVRWRSTYDSTGPLTALLLRVAVKDACRRVAKAAGAQMASG